jgi:hypothetical protein
MRARSTMHLSIEEGMWQHEKEGQTAVMEKSRTCSRAYVGKCCCAGDDVREAAGGLRGGGDQTAVLEVLHVLSCLNFGKCCCAGDDVREAAGGLRGGGDEEAAGGDA